MPFVDSAEPARILGEPQATVHRRPTCLPTGGVAGQVSHGSSHLPSGRRYHLAAEGIEQATWIPGYRVRLPC